MAQWILCAIFLSFLDEEFGMRAKSKSQCAPCPNPVFPSGFTRAEVVRYYRSVWKSLALHLNGRGLILQWFKDGAAKPPVDDRSAPDWIPTWLKTADMKRRRENSVALFWDAALLGCRAFVPNR
jgi:DNA primase